MSVCAAVKTVPEHQAPTMGCIAEASIAQTWPMGAVAPDVAGRAPAEIGGQIARSVYGSLRGQQ